LPTPPSSNRTPSSLQERIDQLQEVAAFPPPAEFARNAQVTDPAVYDLAAADQPAWWAEQVRSRLDWQTPFSTVLDDSNPPFYTWFDDVSGQAVVAYVTVVGEAEAGPGLATDLRDYVGTRIGKFARPKRLIWTGELPKTRSGKIMRRLLRDIAEGRDLGDVTTLADPTVVSALQRAAADGAK